MSTEANKTLARRFYETIFNQHNLAVLDELMPADGIDHALTPGLPPGCEGARLFLQMYLTAFPDIQVTVEDLMAEGDKVVLRAVYRGTHQATLMGIPATGKPIHVTGIDILRVEGGMLVEHWATIDQLGMLQQLGVVPMPG